MNTSSSSAFNNSYRSNDITNIKQVSLPVQHLERGAVIHEDIRNETVEEIQPIVNVEKYKTEIHQVTQPLIDREIRPIAFEQARLAPQVLPEVHIDSRSVPYASDHSTVQREAASMTVERPALFFETDRTQVIEEIQPVIYKETIVPHIIQETKPIYQKIVEGPVFVQETMPVRSINQWKSGSNPTLSNTSVPANQTPL